MLRWSADKTNQERLVDQLSTMGHHENLVLVGKGHMQYRWFRSKLKEQEVVNKTNKEKMKLKAQVEVEQRLVLVAEPR